MGQVKGELESRDLQMQECLSQNWHLQSSFEFFTIQQIPSKNAHVDSLATLAISSRQDLPRVILVDDLYRPAKEKKENVQVHQVRVGPSWMDPLVLFLKEGVLPLEKGKAEKYRGKPLTFGCPRSKSCTNVPSLDHTCFVFTLRQWSHFWKNCTRGYVEVIRGVDY